MGGRSAKMCDKQANEEGLPAKCDPKESPLLSETSDEEFEDATDAPLEGNMGRGAIEMDDGLVSRGRASSLGTTEGAGDEGGAPKVGEAGIGQVDAAQRDSNVDEENADESDFEDDFMIPTNPSDYICASSDEDDNNVEGGNTEAGDVEVGGEESMTVSTFEMYAFKVYSTLVSCSDGAKLHQLKDYLSNDWQISAECVAKLFHFPTFQLYLESEQMQPFVEVFAVVNGEPLYRAVSLPPAEHILRRIADCKLAAEEQSIKRKAKRALDLQRPECAREFVEGKRRIIMLLKELKAYDAPVPFQKIQDLYAKHYEVMLERQELKRMFMMTSAVKVMERVFYGIVQVTSRSPINVKLVDKDTPLPEEVTEEDRAHMSAVSMLPTTSIDPAYSERDREPDPPRRRTDEPERMSAKKVPEKAPTMHWGGDDDSDDEVAPQEGVASRGPAAAATSTLPREPNHFVPPPSVPSAASGRSQPTQSSPRITQNTGASAPRSNPQECIPVDVEAPNLTSDDEDSENEEVKQRVKAKREIQLREEAAKRESRFVHGAFEQPTNMPHSMQNSDQRRDHDGGQVTTQRMRLAGRALLGSMETSNSGARGSASATPYHSNPTLCPNEPLEREQSHLLPRAEGGGTRRHSSVSNDRGHHPRRDRDGGGFANPSIPSRLPDFVRTRDNTSYPAPTESGFAGQTYRSSAARGYSNNHFRTSDSAFYESDLQGEAVAHDNSHGIPEASLPGSEFGNRANVATNTDSDWLDVAMAQMGFSSAPPSSGFPLSSMSPLERLVWVVKTVVFTRGLIQMKDLPGVVGDVYGNNVDPEKDLNYRTTWRRIVLEHCGDCMKLIALGADVDAGELVVFRNRKEP